MADVKAEAAQAVAAERGLKKKYADLEKRSDRARRRSGEEAGKRAAQIYDLEKVGKASEAEVTTLIAELNTERTEVEARVLVFNHGMGKLQALIDIAKPFAEANEDFGVAFAGFVALYKPDEDGSGSDDPGDEEPVVASSVESSASGRPYAYFVCLLLNKTCNIVG